MLFSSVETTVEDTEEEKVGTRLQADETGAYDA
jgi:hypothetical protein